MQRGKCRVGPWGAGEGRGVHRELERQPEEVTSKEKEEREGSGEVRAGGNGCIKAQDPRWNSPENIIQLPASNLAALLCP